MSVVLEPMEKKLQDAEPVGIREKWKKHCIFRVPPHFKVGRGDVFTPKTVSLGPFHHDDPSLRPMEKHKLRAVRRVLRRAGDKTWRELAAAVEDMADELEDAYAELGDEWRGENRERFLRMMVTDGCFLLEVMRSKFEDYDPHDPVLGKHGMRHIEPFVQRDMLMIENQLPLALLRMIVEFENVRVQGEESSIDNIVANFLRCKGDVPPSHGLHPLDLYRRSLLLATLSPADLDRRRTNCCFLTTGATRANEQGTSCLPIRRDTSIEAPRFRGVSSEPEPTQAIGKPPPRSAKTLWESGVRFKRSGMPFYDHIYFNRCTRRLYMPKIKVDDSTEHKLSNLMAFEALHFDAGNRSGVTAFVLFMGELIDSDEDVGVLRKGKVLKHDLAGSDTAVVSLFNKLTKDVAKFNDNDMWRVRKEIDAYCKKDRCRVFIFEAWATLKRLHLSSPWAFMALVFSLWLIGTDITQTVFSVMSYRHDINKDRQERAPAPHVGRWLGH